MTEKATHCVWEALKGFQGGYMYTWTVPSNNALLLILIEGEAASNSLSDSGPTMTGAHSEISILSLSNLIITKIWDMN